MRKSIHSPLPWAGVYDGRLGRVTLLDRDSRFITVIKGDLAVMNAKYIIGQANQNTHRPISIDESQGIIDRYLAGAGAGRQKQAAI